MILIKTPQSIAVRSTILLLGFAVLVSFVFVIWNQQTLHNFRFTTTSKATIVSREERYGENGGNRTSYNQQVDGSSDRDELAAALTRTLKRGLNVITPVSGCHLAAWVFVSGSPDCENVQPFRTLAYNNQSDRFAQIQANDTVYVNIQGLQDLFYDVVIYLKVPITLISGQWQKTDVLRDDIVQYVLNHPRISKWFCQNLDMTVSANMILHPALAPWPYGIQHTRYNPELPVPVELYRDAFWKHLHTAKSKGIMIGYFDVTTNSNRARVSPVGTNLSHVEYYDEIAQHRFLISPDGDRPECYRHYEAIGLGTIPLTQLNPKFYAHLSPAPILYNMSSFWNLSESEAELVDALKVHSHHETDRRMITEEYWIEYVNRIMGAPVRWSDILRDHKQAYFRDFLSEIP
jgi:hypothetical protein